MSERAIQNGYLIAAQNDIENLRARIAALEEVVRAADRMGMFRIPTRPSDLKNGAVRDEWTRLTNDYFSKRAALGEIGGE